MLRFSVHSRRRLIKNLRSEIEFDIRYPSNLFNMYQLNLKAKSSSSAVADKRKKNLAIGKRVDLPDASKTVPKNVSTKRTKTTQSKGDISLLKDIDVLLQSYKKTLPAALPGGRKNRKVSRKLLKLEENWNDSKLREVNSSSNEHDTTSHSTSSVFLNEKLLSNGNISSTAANLLPSASRSEENEHPFPYEQNFQYDNSCDFSDSEEEIVAQQRLQFEKRFNLDFSHVRLKDNERIKSTESTNLELKSYDSVSLGQEINELIDLYHLKLFKGSKVGNSDLREDGYPNQILENVKFLHSKFLSEREKMIPSEADATESIFHSLCTSLLRALCLELEKDLVKTDDVEHLMMSILMLKSDRESLLQHLGSKTYLSSEFFSSVLRTVSNIFGNSDLDEPQSSEKNLDVTSDSPLLVDTYNRAFSVVFHDISNDEGENKIYGNKVLRLTSLHDLAGNIPLSISNLHLLITAYGDIGNIESCMKAEEIYRKNELDRSSTKLFHAVQRAYCQAAFREITKENRLIAIERGERLALEIMKKNVMNHFDRCFSISIALQMLALAGSDCVPNRLKRAENLVVNCIGEFALTQIKHARDEHIQARFVLDSEAKLLRSLLLVYASERDMACLDRALLILRMIENDEIWKVRSSRVKRQDASHDVESPISIISSEVYQSVLHGLHRCTLIKAEPEVVLDLATRATRLLDSMETLKIVPDDVTFDTLLKIWRRVDSISSGRNADMILSKMQMREVYDKAFRISPDMYSKVLQCWKNSAAKGHPQAAERAHQLLLFLETQCGVTSLLSKSAPLKSIPSSRQEKKLELGASIYNLVLHICTRSRTDNALPLAIDIHKRIHNANVIPTVETFNSIFIIITRHMPDDLMSQLKYVDEVVILAKKNGESGSLAFQALQRFHPVLSEAYHRLYSS